MDRLAPQLTKEEHELLPGDIKAGYRFDQESDSYTLDLKPHGRSPGEAALAASRRGRVASAIKKQTIADALSKAGLDTDRHLHRLIDLVGVSVDPDGTVHTELFQDETHRSHHMSRHIGRFFMDLDEYLADIRAQEEVAKPPAQPTAPNAVRVSVIDGVTVTRHPDGRIMLGRMNFDDLPGPEKRKWLAKLGLTEAPVPKPRAEPLTPEGAAAYAALPPGERLRRFRQQQQQT